MNAANFLAASLINFEGVNFTDLTDTIAEVPGVVIPVIVAIGGVRKALGFFSEAIRGA